MLKDVEKMPVNVLKKIICENIDSKTTKNTLICHEYKKLKVKIQNNKEKQSFHMAKWNR